MLTEKIRAIHTWSRGTYGAPRIHAELQEEGLLVACKHVARLMQADGLQGVSRRKAPATTIRRDKDRPAPDLVERNFTAQAPNRLWVAEITYIATAVGFLYLAVVLDAFSRRIVGWSMASHLRTELVLAALEMALDQRKPDGTTRIRDVSTPRLPLEHAAGSLVCVPRWARSATAMTMRCARASSPHSNVNSSTGSGSRPELRLGWPSSDSSKGGTTRIGVIRGLLISRRWRMNRSTS